MKLLLTLLVAAFLANTPAVGTWKANDHGEQIVLILNSDGTGKLDNEPFKYDIKESVMTVTTSTEVLKYNLTVNGNTLKISGGDLDEPLVFTKTTS